MKNYRWLIAVLVLATMLIGLFTGCGAKEEQTPVTESPKVST